MKYDVGLVYRSNHNYGANMTHYALYALLVQWGYRVVMIDMPQDSSYYLPIKRFDPYELFDVVPYEEDSIRFCFRHKWELLQMNDFCKAFLVGSDQLWRNYFVKGTDYYSTLDWVENDKYKMSYATSFGVSEFEGNIEEERKLAKRLQSFQAISLREISGVSIIKKMLHKDAEFVVDPVFLCPLQIYNNLAEKGGSRLPVNKYIAAYVLDRTKEKEQAILKIGKEVGCEDYVFIEDAMCEHDYYENDILNPLRKAKNEEWLATVKNCELLITDSFHGTCFAIIFKKNFLTFTSKDNHRGYCRIQNLLSLLDLEDHIVEDFDSVKTDDLKVAEIDYCSVSQKLQYYVTKSKCWLRSHLDEAMNYSPKVDIKRNTIIAELQRKKKEYEEALNNLSKIDNVEVKPYDEVVIWGTGYLYQKYIKFVNEIFCIKYIVDSDPQKWGEKHLGNICCISPNELFQSKEDKKIIILIENEKVIEEIMKKMNKGDRCITYREIDKMLENVKERL